jgi:hypothetical protein
MQGPFLQLSPPFLAVFSNKGIIAVPYEAAFSDVMSG